MFEILSVFLVYLPFEELFIRRLESLLGDCILSFLHNVDFSRYTSFLYYDLVSHNGFNFETVNKLGKRIVSKVPENRQRLEELDLLLLGLLVDLLEYKVIVHFGHGSKLAILRAYDACCSWFVVDESKVAKGLSHPHTRYFLKSYCCGK